MVSFSDPLRGAVVDHIKKHFPILEQSISGKLLVYLDNGATTQKPRSVIDAISRYYELDNANIHRAPHALAQRATAAYESTREVVRRFIGARSVEEIVYTSGTTHGINLVAYSWGDAHVAEGDEIIVTELEHHSNIVPWQLLARRKRASIKVAKIQPDGMIDLNYFKDILSRRTKIVALTHVSNAIGTEQQVRELIALVRAHVPDAVILIDGAQWIAHGKTDVVDLDCDFYAFSGHKMYGPTGTGILYGKKEILQRMPPFFGGGDMIERVSFDGTTFAAPPARFEAGTPHIAGVLGLKAAIEFINTLNWEEVHQAEKTLGERLRTGLRTFDRVRVIGNDAHSAGITSFTVEGESPLDIAVKLNGYGIAVRAGHHCCMPLMQCLGITGTIRASAAVYNTVEDAHRLLEALGEILAPSHAPASSAMPSKNDPVSYGNIPSESIEVSVASVREDLNACDSPEERQEFLMELGASHPHRLETLRTLVEPLQGCMSEVRVKTHRDSEGRIFIASDSNSQLLRGILSIIERCFSGHTASELRRFNPHSLLTQLQFVDFVSIQRRSGLSTLMKELERAIAKD